ncbi:QbdB protein [Aquitalea magnusonii]|uniref:QbdB protein n=1 Tax=Aquitalea magnusonii TaxID=332411 RepID=A0A3G9GFK3_9NEIS|nr:transporter [Aquitalea magnusonii]BBF85031.1 QbdB protein [Aquitalea magnusonii]
MPHLASSVAINQIRTLQALRETLGGPRLAMAVCDQHGTLHCAEPGFVDLLLTEWPQWTGPGLPAGLSPQGHDDARHPDVSAGANRWAATFLYKYTRGVGKNWVLEASLEAQFYGNNHNYLGNNLQQQPLYRLQAFASYDFTPDTYGALRLYHSRGGALRLNGQELPDTRQNSTQLGVELGHWLSKQDQLLLMLARNAHTTNSFDSSQAMLRLVHVF